MSTGTSRWAASAVTRVATAALGAAAIALVWELLGHAGTRGVRVFPPLSAVIEDYLQASDLYAAHIAATVENAVAGFLIGSVAAFAAALVFSVFPRLEQIFHGVNISLFAVPSVALGPLLVLVLPGTWPQIMLAAIMVYFPTMAAILVGLRDADPRHLDIVSAYGGGRWKAMRYVQFRGAAPATFAGLRVAASLSVLGAILGEFGSGDRWGLGTFLLGSLNQSNAARLWGISVASAAVALTGYGIFAFLGSRVAATTSQVTMAATRVPASFGISGTGRPLARLLLLLASCAMPFMLWSVLLKASGLSPIVAPGPVDVFQYLFMAPDSGGARQTLWLALGQTVPMAAFGMVAGLVFAFGLAASSQVAPQMLRVALPLAMVLQNTPLVALTPIVLLLLGRNALASLAMAVLVVFFPAFVLLAEGFRSVPRAAADVVRVYGGGPVQVLRFVSLPFSRNYVFAAAKLVAPRALLGVMVAEWLLTGVGLGNLMDVSRGTLDYGMIWSATLVSIAVSVVAYALLSLAQDATA